MPASWFETPAAVFSSYLASHASAGSFGFGGRNVPFSHTRATYHGRPGW